MRIFFSFFIFFISIVTIPKDVFAFTCSGPKDKIPVAIDASKFPDNGELVIIDMNKHSFYCMGYINSTFQDAIRIENGTSVLNHELLKAGFQGFYIDGLNKKHNFETAKDLCIWYNYNCATSTSSDQVSRKLNIKIGIRKIASNPLVMIPAGTIIASFTARQRGNYGSGGGVWGGNMHYFSFVLSHDLIIPTYSCNVDNADNIVVKLPPVDTKTLRANIGRYDGVSKPFELNLSCRPGTAVDVTFDGDIMKNHPDVLSNSSSSTGSVGIQILKGSSPVVFGSKNRVIENAQEHESLTYKAHYFYNGGALNPGAVKSLATVTFDYQ